MAYNWQLPDWPDFTYSIDEVEDKLFDFAQRVGRVSGVLAGLPDTTQTEAVIDLMVSEAVKTSEIEGEYLSRQDVMSSIRNNLGLNPSVENVSDKRAEGAAELMIDVRDSYAEPLTQDKLFAWHRMLMKGNRRIAIGEWRSHEEPMQVVSGALGKEKVHYEAPPSSLVPAEMAQFIRWFNETGPGGKNEIKKPILHSAIAHLYFETIHPFEDGNGRIGRAISEKALSQHINRPILLSLSRSIEANKNAYYGALQRAQQSNEVTNWIIYFVDMVLDAQTQAEELIDFTLKKTRFFDRFKNSLNERQLKAIRRMLDEGPKGFEGGMSAKKYISITHTSKATATRDMQDLVEQGVFVPVGGGGRSTRYDLKLDQ
ncbi:Fic family protein [Tunicatimonas pelagia]|uniref:Fic family protein n=1 Tax=Tunicatimonas pelagia TaxID=931531 RepID=UPI002666DE88|nr:Fic family protein [Tunicatimonas pelagia]WKN45385.1 Fic family protein [Tunicatimonas pelagia]